MRESQESQSNSSPRHPDKAEYANDIRVPLSPATDETQMSEAMDEDTDAYDVLATRPRSISLSSQLQSLRDLVCTDLKQQQQQQQQPPVMSVRDHSHHHPLSFRRALAVELPRPARLKTLLNVYFRDVDSYFPFIERERTEAHILQALTRIGYAEHQHIVDVDFHSHSTIALLCNMIAVAECFCASSDRRTEDARPGWTIFVWGRKVLQYCSSPKYVDLDLIRYHALSAEYLMQSEMLQAASQAISNAAQLAMLVRLNDQRAWRKLLSEQELHDRKTLWWAVYFLDRKISQRIGGPYCIRDNEVAVSEFSFESPFSSPRARTQNYMQALVSLAKLWTQIWDSFFATAAPKPADSREIEVMDTRVLVAQRELPSELTWSTGLLDDAYILHGETEPQIRRRLSIFIVSNALTLSMPRAATLTRYFTEIEPAASDHSPKPSSQKRPKQPRSRSLCFPRITNH